MKYFSVPADFKKSTLDKYETLNEMYKHSRVIETYGNITVGNSIESGRQVDVLPRVDLPDLQRYIEYSRERNIEFSYTLNATTLQNREFTREGALEIYNFLRKLHEMGVTSLTVTLPSLIRLVQASGYDFKIKASTLCQITNAARASAYKRQGVERIVLDESINRDLANLRKIRQVFGDKVEIIANAVCFKNCIYRWFHYNQMAADSLQVLSGASAGYYSHRCIMQRYENISNMLRLTWVRPEDLKYYTKTGINYFKLQGRQAVLKGDPVRAVEHYFNESFDGNLMELLDMFDPTTSFKVVIHNKKLDGFIKPFYEKENFCKNFCEDCNYCETAARKCIDYEKARETIKAANMFYSQYDEFERLIEVITNPDKEMNDLLPAREIHRDEKDFNF